ncbi:hypothetical protein CQ12_05610 [Bradyrhizobium jicamae]|uniref:Uncharacterized protein n=1 Tax=Bradyrhizobium jicamae TaxID=280332 RepID=A0A0R3M067_9BRAD|nr:hypothetical protein [Bradyrhizobium jicamae]KRR11301.1 hypothetical protein CQ12_05610 [Bradyrhizobium jicamae]
MEALMTSSTIATGCGAFLILAGFALILLEIFKVSVPGKFPHSLDDAALGMKFKFKTASSGIVLVCLGVLLVIVGVISR